MSSDRKRRDEDSDEEHDGDDDDDVVVADGPVNSIPKDLYIDKCVTRMYEFMNDEKNLKTCDDEQPFGVKPHKQPMHLEVDAMDETHRDAIHTLNNSRSYSYQLKNYDSRMYKSPCPLAPHCQSSSHVDITFSLDGDYVDLSKEYTSMIGGKTRKISINTTALKEFMKHNLHSTTTKDYHIMPVSIRVLNETNDFPSEVGFGMYTHVPGQAATRKLWCNTSGFSSWDSKEPSGLYAVSPHASGGTPVMNRRMMWKCHPLRTTPEFARFVMQNPYTLERELETKLVKPKDFTMEIKGKAEKVYRFACPDEKTRVFDCMLFWILTTYGPVLYKDHLEYPGLTPAQLSQLMVPITDRNWGHHIMVLQTVFDRLIATFQFMMNHRDILMNLDKLEGEISFTRPNAAEDVRQFTLHEGGMFGTFKITVRMEFEKFVNIGDSVSDMGNVPMGRGGGMGGLSQVDIDAIARVMLQSKQDDPTSLSSIMARTLAMTDKPNKEDKTRVTSSSSTKKKKKSKTKGVVNPY
jgi:hypothetical protein